MKLSLSGRCAGAPEVQATPLRVQLAAPYFRLQRDIDLRDTVNLVALPTIAATRDWIQERRRDGHRLYAVIADGHGMLGAFGLGPGLVVAPFFFWLAPAYRQRGFGIRLTKLLCNEARRLGLRHLHSTVRADNIACLRLLQRAGFQQAPVPGADACDSLLLTRVLPGNSARSVAEPFTSETPYHPPTPLEEPT